MFVELYTMEDPHASCDRVDIRRAKITQAIGVVAIINADGILVAISENHTSCHGWVKEEITLGDIGVISVEHVFHDDVVSVIKEGIELCRDEAPPKVRTYVCDVFFSRKTYVTILLQKNATVVIEIEDFNREMLALDPIVDTANIIGKLTSNVLQTKTVNQLCESLFQNPSYDRAMTYKFLDDMSGEVVYEAKKDTLVKSSFLGLRFPADDIPLPARMAYVENPVRFIADVEKISYRMIQKNEDLSLSLSNRHITR